jgi:hypothetical protein
MQKNLLLLLVLVGCGSDDKPATDAAVSSLTCDNYCAEIQANCTGANAQYPDVAHCMGTCAAFAPGTAADQSGNTLGCRIYHAGAPSMMTPGTHCVHAGPGGDLTSATGAGTCGDPCTSFCTIEIKACGSKDAPLTGITAQYQNMAACMTACSGFDKTKAYSTSASGDSLACRLYHVTNASVSSMTAMTHCAHTGPSPLPAGNPCAAP